LTWDPGANAAQLVDHDLRIRISGAPGRTCWRQSPGCGLAPQRLHLLRGTLLGNPAVREVGDDVAFGELGVASQLIVSQAEPEALQHHRVVGLGGHGHRLQSSFRQQRAEDAPVLILVGAMPRDLGRKVPARLGNTVRDPAVLPAALGLAAGRDGANNQNTSSLSKISSNTALAEIIP